MPLDWVAHSKYKVCHCHSALRVGVMTRREDSRAISEGVGDGWEVAEQAVRLLLRERADPPAGAGGGIIAWPVCLAHFWRHAERRKECEREALRRGRGRGERGRGERGCGREKEQTGGERGGRSRLG
eukprot:scaffold40079_cov33-Tisochrysis_lutea.AAC.1